MHSQGQAIIKHIFGTFKRQWGMDDTLVKGREKVKTECRFAAITYNLTRVLAILGIERVKKEVDKAPKSTFCTCGPTWVLIATEYQTNYLH